MQKDKKVEFPDINSHLTFPQMLEEIKKEEKKNCKFEKKPIKKKSTRF